jgi:hypothetical protein
MVDRMTDDKFNIRMISTTDDDYPLIMRDLPNKEKYQLLGINDAVFVPLYQVIDEITGIKADIIKRNGVECCPTCMKPITPQPCEDCISRAEALKAIEKEKQGWELGETRYAIDECHTRIAELPQMSGSGNPNKWIPVTERLPEEVGSYLLSLRIEAAMCPSLNSVVKGYWTANDKWQFEMESGVIANYYVEAYMPLPEPYKEGESE